MRSWSMYQGYFISSWCALMLFALLSSCAFSISDQVAGDSLCTESDFIPPEGAVSGPGQYGPWNMRLMSARSSDGLNFARTNQVICDQGDVPDLVVDRFNRIFLYYVAWTAGSQTNRTVVAVSCDQGESWAFHYLSLAGFEGFSDPVDPDVLMLADGTFRLFLTADPGDGQGPRTYVADGNDGLHFQIRDVAFAMSGRAVLDPSTLQIGTYCHLFAGGDTVQSQANWHGISLDGLTFSYLDEIVLSIGGDRYAMANGIVISSGGRFYCFSHTSRPHIASFFSRDGLVWTPDPGRRLELDTSTGLEQWGVKDPAVTRLPDGSYLMVYVTRIP